MKHSKSDLGVSCAQELISMENILKGNEKREAISRDDFATCTQSYFLYGIHYGSRLVCRHTAKVLPRVTRSRYTSVGKETLCRVSFLEHTAKKKSALDSHLTGHCSFAVCQGRCTRQRGEMHTSNFEFLLLSVSRPEGPDPN